MNMNNAINSINLNVTKPLHATLEDRFGAELEIHLEPYAELNDKQLDILQAIADDIPMVDEHNLRGGKVPNPYSHYAIYKRGKETHICPIHDSSPTCMNPLSLEDDYVVLGRWSVGGVATANQLKALVKEGHLVGYVIKR